ncbi:MAG: Fis family transcriptional regulator [Desulfovibrio sp. S3730MH75]|nr:MAG: Fis family transcriptional regulator [Desulfovibrio sp. S3730MH75]
MANVLIIDDDPHISDLLCVLAEHLGHNGEYALTLKDGLALAREERFDVVFLDVVLPDGNGLDALPELQQLTNTPEVVIITGKGNTVGAELAINSGAWDYISKPASTDQYLLHMQRVLQYRSEKQASHPKLGHHNIVGRSKSITRCLDQAAKVAESHISVSLFGETGTGKELFAKAVHDNSPRRKGPFIVVDCATIPENLVESTLFGTKNQDITGKSTISEGLIAKADGGTLFLDEVGELSLAIQKSFLRVLQEHTFRPVGSHNEVKSDFRLVTSTNLDLDALVQTGRFRQDLLYRLQAYTIELPSLRQRKEDIPELTRYFFNKLSIDSDATPISISDDFMKSLATYSWPGNIRELFNVLEQIFTTNTESSEFIPIHLPVRIRVAAAQHSMLPKTQKKTVLTVIQGNKSDVKKTSTKTVDLPRAELLDTNEFPELKTYREQALEQAEKLYLESLFLHCKGNITQASNISGLSNSRVYALLKKYDIKKTYFSS